MSWFIQIGEHRLEFVSFNDDSSPDQRVTGEKVSIHAQVLPGKDLSWYYNIIPLFPVTGEELKSRRAIEAFNGTSSGKKEAYWRNGLSDIRIHIVDPTLPKQRIEKMLRSLFRRDDAFQWLEREARGGSLVARAILRFTREHLAESILLFNSSAGKPHHLIEFHKKDGYIPLGNVREKEAEPLPISLADFSCDTKSLVRKATEWSTKSAAVFHEGIDGFHDAFALHPSAKSFTQKSGTRRVISTNAPLTTYSPSLGRRPMAGPDLAVCKNPWFTIFFTN